MKTVCYTLVMAFLMSLSGCGSSTLSTIESYVGSDELRLTYHQSRLYAISNQEIDDVAIQVNYDQKVIGTTTRQDSDLPAYHTGTFTLRDGQIIIATATLVDGGEDVETRLLANLVDGEWELSITDQELPDRPDVDGNEVDVDAFMAAFNEYRARHGLSAVEYSVALTEDAAENNRRQQRSGLGHHYMGRASGQNSAMGYADISAVMSGWHNSSGHRRNMQGGWTCMGIHKQGSYWTQNFSRWSDGCR